jgi:cob(I)alamin adenosyltransferase
MKLYTKRGDDGTTSLVGGKRVSKAHQRVMAYGDMDELISWLGLLRSEVSEDFQLRRIQIFLMQASAHLASDHQVAKLKPLDEAEILFLESEIDRMTNAIPAATIFLAIYLAAYAAERSTLLASLPEKAPPPCAPFPP